jgi:hypothetical protein
MLLMMERKLSPRSRANTERRKSAYFVACLLILVCRAESMRNVQCAQVLGHFYVRGYVCSCVDE